MKRLTNKYLRIIFISILFNFVLLADGFGGAENRKIVHKRIITVYVNKEDRTSSIETDIGRLEVLKDAEIVNSNYRKCNLKSLRLPFSARIVTVLGSDAKDRVVSIRPSYK